MSRGTSTLSTRPARAGDIRSLARVLALAFADDPVMAAIHPHAGGRTRRLPQMFAVMARHFYLPYGGVDLADRDGTLVGAALWTPPGHAVPPPWRTVAALPGLVRATGRRIGVAAAVTRALERAHPSRPHWYLGFVGVCPQLRGTGVGDRLLRDRLAVCDRDRLPAYLEASRAELTTYYERFGFAVAGEIRLPGGPSAWAMWREPSTNDTDERGLRA